MSTEQHISPSAIVTKAGVGVDGPGYLAGEHPAGRTTVNGTPVSADVDVFYELDTKDWQCVASTTSQPDGTWGIVGLNPDKKFNVVARHASFGGVIAVDVQPSRTDVVTLSGAFTANDDFNGVAGFMTIESGMPPFTASVVDPLPYGMNPLVVDGRKLIIDGTSDDVGLWESVVRVTASNGVWVDVPVQVQIQVPSDPHWDKVVALLHFDWDLTDETGRVWHLGESVFTEDGRFDGGLRRYGGSDSTYTDSLELYDDTYTIEFWYRQDANKGQFSAIFAVGVDNILFRVHPGGGIELLTNYNTYVGSGISPIIGGWYHICIQRNDEGVLGWYVDGIYRGGVVGNPYNGPVHIGYSPKDPNDAWFTLDELRITKGVARYTKNFTPPVNPFPSR